MFQYKAKWHRPCCAQLHGVPAVTTLHHALAGLRVLVVEDVADILEVFTALLRADGAEVATAPTGREAAELVRRQEFDAVLSDLGLPDIPGEVLIRDIRAATKHGTRVAAITGFGEPHVSLAREAGADVVFTKPVEWPRVVEYLGGRNLLASA